MLNPLFSVAVLLITMGFMEALFKPFSITFFKYRLFPHTGKAMQILDPIMPQAIAEKSGEELQAYILDEVVKQTQDPSWRNNPFKSKIALKQFERNHSVLINADHASQLGNAAT